MNYGAVLGLFLVAIAVIMWSVGADDKQSVIPALLNNGITIAFIAYAIIQYRDINNNGFITYAESLKLGTTVAFFSSIILAFYQFIYISYLDPNSLSEIMKITEQAMLESNPEISDEELDMALQMTSKFMQPHWMMIMGMLGGTFMGFLYSLIISFFTKKYKVSDLDQEITVKNVKKRRYVLAVITCFVICITFVIFQNKDTNYESRNNTDSESNNQSSKPNKQKSINGVYSYADSSVKSTITVSGSRWRGKLVLITGFGSSYDNSDASYSSGIVKDGKLYDDSGHIELGSVNGTSLTRPIGSSRVTHYK